MLGETMHHGLQHQKTTRSFLPTGETFNNAERDQVVAGSNLINPID